MGHAVASMQRHHVRRMVAISTFGAGDTRPRVGWIVKHLVFGVVLRSEVAGTQKIPSSFMAKILRGLVRAGLLRSSRGVHGGFALALESALVAS